MSALFPIERKELDAISSLLPEDILSWAEESGDVQVYGIAEGEQTVGCAAVHVTGLRAELLWYYVTEAYRGYGIGSDCFFALLSRLRDAGADEVLVTLSGDTDSSLMRLILSYQPELESMTACHVSFPAEAVNSIHELLKPSAHCVSLRDCSREELSALHTELAEEGRDIFDVTAEGYNTSISAIYKKDGEAKGALLFRRKKSHEINLAFAGSVSKDGMAMIDMLRYSAGMIRQLPAGTLVGMTILNQKLKDFMFSVTKNLGDVTVTEGRLAILSLSYVDEIREEAAVMAEISKELDGKW